MGNVYLFVYMLDVHVNVFFISIEVIWLHRLWLCSHQLLYYLNNLANRILFWHSWYIHYWYFDWLPEGDRNFIWINSNKKIHRNTKKKPLDISIFLKKKLINFSNDRNRIVCDDKWRIKCMHFEFCDWTFWSKNSHIIDKIMVQDISLVTMLNCNVRHIDQKQERTKQHMWEDHFTNIKMSLKKQWLIMTNQ